MTPTSGDSPWPPGTDGPVLFLIDARNDVERRRLTNWVSASATVDSGAGGAPMLLDVDEPDRSGRLRSMLDGDPSLTIVPLRVVWVPEKGPRQSGPRIRDLVIGDPRNPRPAIARLTVRRHPERCRAIAGGPATVADLRRRHEQNHLGGPVGAAEDLEEFVVRMAGIALDVAERQLQGQRYKVPRLVREGVAATPSYKAAVASLSTELGRTPAEVAKEAQQHLGEMVATPSTFFIDWSGKVTRWIVSLAYGEVITDPANIEQARAWVRDHPSAFLWSHKSHVDGIALLSVLYDNDFPAPHSVGGMNMAFKGMGYMGRRAGIIYIRRSFQDAPIYKLALQQYIGYLLEKRFPFSWAFEGTRSRNGKLMPPRYGMLKYVVDGARATHTEDLHLIPVTISYDLIGEADEYAAQEAGAPKTPESIGWFVQYLKRLRSPMGRVYLDFAEPVVLENDENELPSIAFEVARRVNQQVPVTLPALMCTTLLGASPRALTFPELDLRLRSLIDWLHDRNVRMASSFDEEDAERLQALAGLLFKRGIINRVDTGPATLFAIGHDQFPIAGYYRNTIAHYFLDKAIAELALIRVADSAPSGRLAEFRSEARWIRDALKFEFFHTPSELFQGEIDCELARSDPEWSEAIEEPGCDVHALLAGMAPLLANSILQPFVEAYGIVAEVAARLEPSESLDEKECLARSLTLGEQFLLQQRISSRASIGKQMFKGAYSLLADKHLHDPGGLGQVERRTELAARFRDLSARLMTIRELSLASDPPVSANLEANLAEARR